MIITVAKPTNGRPPRAEGVQRNSPFEFPESAVHTPAKVVVGKPQLVKTTPFGYRNPPKANPLGA